MSTSLPKKEVVLLIRGTRLVTDAELMTGKPVGSAPSGEDVASNEEYAVPNWTDPDSEFCQTFFESMGRTKDDFDFQTFDWTGDNLESVRRQAAHELQRDFIDPLEQGDQQYHVVAHSHGGSVFWQAMKELAKRDKNQEFKNLATWTTIGAPFLHFRSKWRGPAMLIPLFLTLGIAGVACFFAWWGFFQVANPIHGDAFGSFWAEGWGNRLRMMFWIACLVGVSVAFFWFSLRPFVLFLTGVWADRQDADAATRVWKHCGSKWLGIHSDVDEAIRGLQHTLQLNGGIIPAWSAPASPVLRTLLSPIRGTWNGVVLKFGNDFIWAMLTNRFQGNDTVSDVVTDVSPYPILESPLWPPLEERTSRLLTHDANEAATETLTKLREQFAEAFEQNITGRDLILSLLRLVSWRELVHTGYFPETRNDCLEIPRLAALHVLHSRGDVPDTPEHIRTLRTQSQDFDWYEDVREKRRDVSPHQSPKKLPSRWSLNCLGTFNVIVGALLGLFFVWVGFTHELKDYSRESRLAHVIEQSQQLGGAIGRPIAVSTQVSVPVVTTSPVSPILTTEQDIEWLSLSGFEKPLAMVSFRPVGVPVYPVESVLKELQKADRKEDLRKIWYQLPPEVKFSTLPHVVETIIEDKNLTKAIQDKTIFLSEEESSALVPDTQDAMRHQALVMLAAAYRQHNDQDSAKELLKLYLERLENLTVDPPISLVQPRYRLPGINRLYGRVLVAPLLVELGNKEAAKNACQDALKALKQAEELAVRLRKAPKKESQEYLDLVGDMAEFALDYGWRPSRRFDRRMSIFPRQFQRLRPRHSVEDSSLEWLTEYLEKDLIAERLLLVSSLLPLREELGEDFSKQLQSLRKEMSQQEQPLLGTLASLSLVVGRLENAEIKDAEVGALKKYLQSHLAKVGLKSNWESENAISWDPLQFAIPGLRPKENGPDAFIAKYRKNFDETLTEWTTTCDRLGQFDGQPQIQLLDKKRQVFSRLSGVLDDIDRVAYLAIRNPETELPKSLGGLLDHVLSKLEKLKHTPNDQLYLYRKARISGMRQFLKLRQESEPDYIAFVRDEPAGKLKPVWERMAKVFRAELVATGAKLGRRSHRRLARLVHEMSPGDSTPKPGEEDLESLVRAQMAVVLTKLGRLKSALDVCARSRAADQLEVFAEVINYIARKQKSQLPRRSKTHDIFQHHAISTTVTAQ